MNHETKFADRGEKQWKADCIYVQFVYNLCTIYVQFFVLSHITINELRHQICTIAYKRIFS